MGVCNEVYLTRIYKIFFYNILKYVECYIRFNWVDCMAVIYTQICKFHNSDIYNIAMYYYMLQ